MTTTPAPDLGDHLRHYRAQIVWGSLAVVGLVVPRLSVLLQKSGEGWEFHNLAVGLSLLLAWFLLTIVVVTLGTPFRWALIIGVAPAVSTAISGLLHTASRYANARHDFWVLILTGDEQAIQVLILEGSFVFLVGIPPALIAYVIGRKTREHLDEGRNERLSRMRSLLLVALALLSVYVARFIERSISVTIFYS